ncbi:uncharacterized protein [Physcomitrium patens]|uniref:Uncharacterized protein n=1 Tax=Physcomitrium patens TaxID=3218 RepID=A0A7I4EZT1_PHYPA|nr:uncharacterized protein LOC112287300 [Physcomitrium patens]XP_024385954.1 uncharacterized protein LOC112287300 [Physcomitrium patens]XP_024385955.1 uncharacterized protein LOC112287300 [Physcomitrium patens]XP_024385957.1 uncharacterized protein LOC112287300 [Physcomitrium patens]XP_024385958.1 uncharacterized protein LOC112287300 [Physcomitrium patens]|eukprot:XP_024385953.1 uncharacterized protein LOC112287300 [Physcomitrella patens]
MASSDGIQGSLPPSLSGIQTPPNQSSGKLSSGSPGSEDEQTLFQRQFSEINQDIDVEKEITQFVKELDANEGREEFVFTTKTSQYDGEGSGQYPKNLLSAPGMSSESDTEDHTPASASNHIVDNVSSLKMTYYAFKETTGQKSGIPVSLLAAHLERKESRYPSFLGSRSSVNMTGNTSTGTFRTMQRSPSRRTSMEITYPALSPQVMEVIDTLESHKKKAENEGNYMVARAAAQRLNGVKVLEDNKRKSLMLQRHGKEREESERTYKQETAERNRLWDEKLHEFHKAVVEHAAKLKRQQIGVLQAFRQRMANKTPTKPQWSRELLKHRKVQTFLGKQGKYLEADEVKRIADRMEHTELQATLSAYAAEVALKEQALRNKQQNEMEVLLQRAAQGRDELRKTRNMDLDRCTQRHKNIVRELKNLQKQEQLRFEQIFGKRVSEFKRSGGSLQLLSETLSGLDALMLPGIEAPCPERDEVASSCSSDLHGSG